MSFLAVTTGWTARWDSHYSFCWEMRGEVDLFGDKPRLLGQIMSNSPLTKFFTSADKLTDPRKATWQKALNLLSGARITDVDVDKQRAVETRAALEQMMAGHPELSKYTSFHVKPEDASKLTPEDILMMRKYTMLQDQARKFAKQKREQIAAVPGSAGIGMQL